MLREVRRSLVRGLQYGEASPAPMSQEESQRVLMHLGRLVSPLARLGVQYTHQAGFLSSGDLAFSWNYCTNKKRYCQ